MPAHSMTAVPPHAEQELREHLAPLPTPCNCAVLPPCLPPASIPFASNVPQRAEQELREKEKREMFEAIEQ